MTINKTLRSLIGVGALCGAGLAVQAANPVTFQIDMSAQAPTDVFVRGTFNDWGNSQPAWALTNNGAQIWSGTFDDTNSPGAVESCKFFYQPGDTWEADPNRQFILAGGAQTLPLTSWNVKDWPTPTNNVTFQLDMTAQILAGAYIPGTDSITVSGVFNGWGAGDPLTNNPALLGALSNIYSAVLPVTGFAGSTIDGYKFRENAGWESPASTGGNNRSFKLTGGDQVLPLVYYNDATPCDLVQQPTPVTFRLWVTNGTASGGGTILFDKSVNKLYLNGEFLGWWSWNTGFGGAEGPQYELTNNPVGSDFFEQTLTIPAGKSLATTYKYSMDGFDNEANAQTNHVRYIRSLSGVPYTMPVDLFGTNGTLPVIESSFGNLSVAAPVGAYIPITWSGRQCVTLQTKSSVTSLDWQDIAATEGTSATNWPNNGDTHFFRLKKSP